MLEISDAVLSSRSTLRELRGLSASAVPSHAAMLQLTALRALSLVGPFNRTLGLPTGLRSLHLNNADDVKASPFFDLRRLLRSTHST